MLAKSTSKMKQTLTDEDKKFLRSMNDREKELKYIYEKLRGNKDGEALLEMVLNGEIKPNERDGLGLCPFLFAIDAEMDLYIIQRLVKEGGCDL